MAAWTTWLLLAVGHPVAAVTVAVGSAAALPRKLPDVPPAAAFELAMRGHIGAAEQIIHALRREWWPFLAVGALVSRRARWIALAALLRGAATAPTDIAYGWGVWRGVLRHRTTAPIWPRLIAWPTRNYGRTT